MVVDAVRTYLDAANGLTELSRKQAVAAAKTLLRANGTGGPGAPGAGDGDTPPPRVGQSIQTLAGELIETSQSNRTAIADLVRAEVERQLERMDVVPRGEHDRLVRRVAELERRLAARHAVERALTPEAAGPASLAHPAAPTAAEPADALAQAAVPDERTPADTARRDPARETTRATAQDTAPDTGQRSARAADAAPAPAAPADAGTDTAEGAEDPAGEDSAPAAARSGAKARTRTAPAPKTARTRAPAKRTAKGKGATKK